LDQYAAIQAQMEQQGLEGDVLALFKFIKAGIEGREHSKFVFTKSLSDALEMIVRLGAEHGFTFQWECLPYFPHKEIPSK
jgi:hypothetical protein